MAPCSVASYCHLFFPLISLQVILKCLQTSHQIPFNKCHHSKRKDEAKVAQVPIMLFPSQGRRGSQLVSLSPIALFMQVSSIQTGKKAYDATNFIRLDLNFNYNTMPFVVWDKLHNLVFLLQRIIKNNLLYL